MARPGYSIGTKAGGGGSVKSLIVSLHGMGLIAFAALTRKIALPESGVIQAITLNVAARGGTHSTSTVDVKSGSTSLLTALFDVAALTPGTPVEKLAANLTATGQAVVAKDAVISIVTAESGGTSPTWQGVDLQIDYVPVGD
jgi:hypothetical protein